MAKGSTKKFRNLDMELMEPEKRGKKKRFIKLDPKQYDPAMYEEDDPTM